jgi:hypothetical protein
VSSWLEQTGEILFELFESVKDVPFDDSSSEGRRRALAMTAAHNQIEKLKVRNIINPPGAREKQANG